MRSNLHLLGDPHVGRKFETGVPLNKRGLREARQMKLLEQNLHAINHGYNVCVGDLFDHPHVGYKVVLDTAQLFLEAAQANPNVTYAVLAGNHDLPRNLGVVGAFDAFEEIVADRVSNLFVVRKPSAIDGMLLCPWQWGVTALEQVEKYHGPSIHTVIGHYDLQSYGGDDSHICPAKELNQFRPVEIYSGHYHIPGDYQVNGYTVHCTGSMEPYSHGEDPEGKTYVTLTLDEATDGRDLSDKCVRVVLADGEELPADLDCMALTAIKAKAVADDEDDQIDFEKFEWGSVLKDAMKDLDEEVRTFIMERISSE